MRLETVSGSYRVSQHSSDTITKFENHRIVDTGVQYAGGIMKFRVAKLTAGGLGPGILYPNDGILYAEGARDHGCTSTLSPTPIPRVWVQEA